MKQQDWQFELKKQSSIIYSQQEINFKWILKINSILNINKKKNHVILTQYA